MAKTITIQDNGSERYTVISTINTLGRRYDNNAESIVVNFPQAEIDASHICTMIVTAYGKVIDHIEVENGVEVPITSNLSQYSEIKIGFSFTDDEGYVKNSEIKTFKFLEAQKPDGFVPEPPQQSGSIDRLIRSGFVDVGQQGSYVIFYNMAHEEVARIRIQGGGGGGGCTVYVNGEEVDELLFTSDPQTQITALAEAMTLVQNSLSEKATIEYVDAKFNGASKAISYGDYETMITAFNALDGNVYGIGQDVYIVTRDVPDLWISSVEETSVPYVYVDDATFVTALTTTGYVQVGYYKFSYLETQKVDLTNYVTKDTEQTLTGKKKILDTELSFANTEASGNAVWSLEADRYGQLSLYRTYNNVKSKMFEFNGNALKPIGANGNLGSSSQKFANVYTDNLNDGTNSITVADIANKNKFGYAIMSATDFNTLTEQEKAEAIYKGLIVIGSITVYNNVKLKNPVFMPSSYTGYYDDMTSTTKAGLLFYTDGSNNANLIVSTWRVQENVSYRITINDTFNPISLNANTIIGASNIIFKTGAGNRFILDTNGLTPVGDKDLGTSSAPMRDIYARRNLSDGTNSVSIAELIPTKVDYSSALVVDNDTNLTVKRKELYFVKSKNTIKMFVYYSAKNETESAVNSVRIINTNVVVNDTFIANGIKDMNGNVLSSSISGTICSANQNIYNDGNVLTKAIRVSHTSTNQLTLYDGSAINIPAGANVTIDFMVEWFVG